MACVFVGLISCSDLVACVFVGLISCSDSGMVAVAPLVGTFQTLSSCENLICNTVSKRVQNRLLQPTGVGNKRIRKDCTCNQRV